MPAVEVNTPRGNERAQLDELAGRDVERAQGRARRPSSVTSPRTQTGWPQARTTSPGADRAVAVSWPSGDLPLVAPDLEVHVDDVVVGDRDAAEPVVDAEACAARDCAR